MYVVPQVRYMSEETDDSMNERQADVGDVPDLDPVDRLEQSLEQLDEAGELDSERITFDTTSIGGVHLDRIGEELSEVDYGRDPVRITIEPEIAHPDDHHYRIGFEDLERVPDDPEHQFVPEGREGRLRRLAEHVRGFDCLVPCEIDDFDDVGVYRSSGEVCFEVEATEADVADHTSHELPEVVGTVKGLFDAEISGLAFYPDDKGWGEPTYAVTLKVE